MSAPLRYQISNWKQLPGALSNNSRDLHIRVADFVGSENFTGLRISVEHSKYGVLFATVVDARGSIVSDMPNVESEMSAQDILTQLARFGFLITYHNYENLSGDQVTFLMTLDNLHFDKIRIMRVYRPEMTSGGDYANTCVVAFKVEQLPGWLQASYSCSQSEFNKALNQGWAVNVSSMSQEKNYKWDWLVNYVANIRDVLNDNAGLLQYDFYGEENRQWP